MKNNKTVVRLILAWVVSCAILASAQAALTAANMAEIQAGMQNLELFKGLPLGGDPGDLSRHWEALLKISQMSGWNAFGREAACRGLSAACLNDLKVMNLTLADSKLQVQFQDPDARRAFAVRYYHLLYFIYQYYRVMGWGWGQINSDFATTGWPNAGDYRWQANAAKLRGWLGAAGTQSASAQPVTGTLPLPAQSVRQNVASAGGRSVREIEAAIRRQQNYIKDLERKLDRANDDYSSYQSSERQRVANGGRVSRGGLINAKLRTVHNFERLIRENERTLEQMEAELEAARMREEQAAAAKEKQKSEAAVSATAPSETESAQPISTSSASAPAANRFCTECGAKAASGAKFCGACGHKL